MVFFFNFLHILRELLISLVLIVALIEHNQECNIENNDKFVTIVSTYINKKINTPVTPRQPMRLTTTELEPRGGNRV